MPHMYILECADGSYYTGSTGNLEVRLWEHQNGLGARHTAKRLPVKLVYCEFYARVEDAFHREKQVQGWSRLKKQALIEEHPEKLIEYARNYSQYPRAVASTGSAAGAGVASTGSATGEGVAWTGSAAGTGVASTSSATGEALPEPVEGNAMDMKELGYGG